MCGRIGFDIRPAQLAERFPGIRIPEDLPPRHNVAPTHQLLTIGEQAQTAEMRRWSIDGGSSTGHFNLRQETIAQRPAYQRLPRVLVPVSHFYEWSGSQPMLVRRKDGRPLLLEGLAGNWQGVPAVTLLTAPAAGPIAALHHRMPVMLDWPAVLEIRPVSRLVNNVRNDGPELLLPPAEFQLSLLD